MTQTIRRAAMMLALAATVGAGSACAPRQPVSLQPLPDRPWTILAGDLISVKVYRDNEASSQATVNGRGEIYLPVLGRLTVSGMTIDSLTQLISAGYEKRLLNSITDVSIERSIPVVGEVRLPGEVQARPTMTVQQLVARAGGQRSSTSRQQLEVYLRKGKSGLMYRMSNDLRLDRVPLEEGDAVVVYDPAFLERWGPWIETFNRFATALTLAVTLIYIGKK